MSLRFAQFIFVLAVSFNMYAEDMLALWQGPGKDVHRGLLINGKSIYTIQGFALAYAWNQEQCDIIRMRFAPGIDARSFEEAQVIIPTELAATLAGEMSKFDSTSIDEMKWASRYGWPPNWQSSQIFLCMAMSLKKHKLRPTCLVRLHFDSVINIASDFHDADATKKVPDAAKTIFAEHFVQNLDVFSGKVESSDTEYIVMVERAPESHPFIQKLRATLGEQWDIVVQMLPEGRAGLATLALSRWWAGLESMRNGPGYEEAKKRLLGGVVGIAIPQERDLNVLGSLYSKIYRDTIDSRMAMVLKPYPDAIQELPIGWRITVPACFVYGSMNELWRELNSTNLGDAQQIKNTTNRVMLKQAKTMLTKPDQLATGGDLYKNFMVSLSSLPLPITEQRRIYPLMRSMSFAEWKKMVDASVWAKDAIPLVRQKNAEIKP